MPREIKVQVVSNLAKVKKKNKLDYEKTLGFRERFVYLWIGFLVLKLTNTKIQIHLLYTAF